LKKIQIGLGIWDLGVRGWGEVGLGWVGLGGGDEC